VVALNRKIVEAVFQNDSFVVEIQRLVAVDRAELIKTPDIKNSRFLILPSEPPPEESPKAPHRLD
jgi:hypothetical protein